MTTTSTTLTDVSYRYFLTDLVSNQVIAEIPFSGVSYERAIRKAGSFSGTIAAIEATKNYNLYEVTMPGRTGLYVLRNGVCVWGGMIWSRSYSESSKQLSVDASEFTSYLYHRNIWQTLIYGSEFIGISSFSIASGVATVVTEEPHGFQINDFVKITFTNPTVNGTHKVTSVSSSNQFSFIVSAGNVVSTPITSGAVRKLVDTYDFVRDLVARLNNDLGGVNFANEVIEPGETLEHSVISLERENGEVTIKTLEEHSLVPGQEFELIEVNPNINGLHTVKETPDSKTVIFELFGSNIPLTAASGIRTLYVTQRSLTNNVATITTHLPHGGQVGQKVFLSGIDSFFSERLDILFDGEVTIKTVPTPTTFTYDKASVLDYPIATVSGGTATLGSRINYGTYGPYTANSDIDIQVGTNKTSGLYQDTQIIRGFELKTFGEVLEDYSNNLNGFEYRIDCDYDFSTASFTRTFTLLNIENPNEISESVSYTDEERLGYNEVVFEYPGSISTFTIEESAEDAATRFFVEGNISDLSDAASQPYAVAADETLLNNQEGRSWPLLDQVEVIQNTGDEDTLYSYAQEYLYESKPPIGDIKITVNGSLTPIVGSYLPGDWCSLIIDDPFMLARLADDQEPRDDILVRKIQSYKVSVPDTPAFPETVDIDLITDWKVDQAGRAAGLQPSGGN
jgi:hypothetical protein